MSARLPARLLATAGIAVVPLALLGLGGVRVAVVPWMLLALLAGVVWWATSDATPAERAVGWHAPRPDPPPMRFTADLRTRRVVTMIDDAQPTRGFTGAALAATLAERARARLARGHGLVGPDALDRAGPLLSPQLLEYLRRADTDQPLTVSQRTLRIYLKELEAL